MIPTQLLSVILIVSLFGGYTAYVARWAAERREAEIVARTEALNLEIEAKQRKLAEERRVFDVETAQRIREAMDVAISAGQCKLTDEDRRKLNRISR